MSRITRDELELSYAALKENLTNLQDYIKTLDTDTSCYITVAKELVSVEFTDFTDDEIISRKIRVTENSTEYSESSSKRGR